MKNLITRFDAAVKSQWEPHPLPTNESVMTIMRRLGVDLPFGLLEFAQHSGSFSSFFLGIGPDYDGHSNIISRNDYWRKPEGCIPLPAHLVMFTDGFMDDNFWCFDRRSLVGGEYSIQYWAPEVDPADFPPPYPSFGQFMTFTVEWYEGMRV